MILNGNYFYMFLAMTLSRSGSRYFSFNIRLSTMFLNSHWFCNKINPQLWHTEVRRGLTIYNNLIKDLLLEVSNMYSCLTYLQLFDTVSILLFEFDYCITLIINVNNESIFFSLTRAHERLRWTYNIEIWYFRGE